MPLTVGTAGHVDHGKTALVRALTGKHTDRLPEERARGISIDLGYAPLELPSGRSLSLVDVPGHERLVRTMVAGATGLDLFLLVVDAAEGARPQTHEHLAVLRLLGVEHGVVAVTKADAVDDETVELAVEEARELVPDAPVVAVSAVTGTGLDELREALDSVAEAKLARGQSMEIGDYTLVYRSLDERQVANATEVRATLEVRRGDRDLGTLEAGKNAYTIEQQVSNEVGIRSDRLTGEDLFVITEQIDPDGSIYFRVFVKPLVNLIWVAGLVFLLGSVITLWPDAREQRRLVSRAGEIGVPATR